MLSRGVHSCRRLQAGGRAHPFMGRCQARPLCAERGWLVGAPELQGCGLSPSLEHISARRNIVGKALWLCLHGCALGGRLVVLCLVKLSLGRTTDQPYTLNFLLSSLTMDVQASFRRHGCSTGQSVTSVWARKSRRPLRLRNEDCTDSIYPL